MTPSDPNELTLHADKEHAGLRLVVLVIVFAGTIIGFLIFLAILRSREGLLATYAYPISCLLGLVVALATASGAETQMKRYWHSGRRVVIDDRELRAWLPNGEVAALDWSGRVWASKWTFSLAGYPRGGRERRLTKEHHCLACQLQQDERRVIVFVYASGRKAEALLEESSFHAIRPADYYDRRLFRSLTKRTDRPQIPIDVMTGKDGPYWLAEQRRWTEGLELTAEDFATFWEAVKDRVEA